MASGFYFLDNPNPNGQHFYTSRRSEIAFVVVHTAENLPDFDPPDMGAERVAAYGARTDRNASWHQTVDSDSVVACLPDDHTAWHVKGYNSASLGVEIATQAHRWGDGPADWEAAVLQNTADVVGRWCIDYGIPAVKLSQAEVDAGEKGLVSHSTLDPSRRSDPGIGFPWELLLEKVQARIDGAAESASEEPEDEEPKPTKKSKKKSSKKKKKSDWFEELIVSLPTVKRGSSGRDVAKMQHLLRGYRYYLKVDGIFGTRTDRAVTEFQEQERIMVDGVVGPQTWRHLLRSERFHYGR